MSGKHSGVAARIKTDAKHAVYVHCNAHCLNLVLVDTVKAVPEADCFFSLLQKALRVYVWVLCTPEVAGCAKRNVRRSAKGVAEAQ